MVRLTAGDFPSEAAAPPTVEDFPIGVTPTTKIDFQDEMVRLTVEDFPSEVAAPLTVEDFQIAVVTLTAVDILIAEAFRNAM